MLYQFMIQPQFKALQKGSQNVVTHLTCKNYDKKPEHRAKQEELPAATVYQPQNKHHYNNNNNDGRPETCLEYAAHNFTRT
jgi:hypothetical protein